MIKFLFSLLFCCLCLTGLSSHEGHHTSHEMNQQEISFSDDPSPTFPISKRTNDWLQFIGSFHLILLHFPIALVILIAIADYLFYITGKELYAFTSTFMLFANAILAPLTALFGLLFRYTAVYEGQFGELIWWHMWLGIATAIVSLVLLYLYLKHGKKKGYYLTLALLFLLVIVTGFIGGAVSFGPTRVLPP